MAREKSQYNFTINCEPATANDTIMQFLNENGFVLEQENGVQYYHDHYTLAPRCFEYSISGNQVTIYAYLGKPSKPVALTDGLYGVAMIAPYKSMLKPLFEVLSSSNIMSQQSAATTSITDGNRSAIAQSANGAEPPVNFASHNSSATIIALVISFVGLVLAFTDVAYLGLLSILYGCATAINNLKTKQRVLAIITLIANSINVILLIVAVIKMLSR